MRAQPVGPPPSQRIQIDGEDAVIVPLRELRVLRALREQASPEAIAAAELAAEIAEDEPYLAEYRAWEAAGRLGAVSLDEVMALLASRQ